VEKFYEWVRRETPRQSIFVTNPEAALKMSGDVSELPAFTGRTQFTDAPNLTGGHADLASPYADSALRRQLALAASRGEALSPAQRQYLVHFGRPIYLVTYHGGRKDLIEGLESVYGPAMFHQGMVAVFPMVQVIAP